MVIINKILLIDPLIGVKQNTDVDEMRLYVGH